MKGSEVSMPELIRRHVASQPTGWESYEQERNASTALNPAISSATRRVTNTMSSKRALTMQDMDAVPVIAEEGSTTGTLVQYRADFTLYLRSAHSAVHAEALAHEIADAVNKKVLRSQPDVGNLIVNDVVRDDPSICDYCGEPYDRCPCGRVDHWNKYECERCGKKPT